MRIFSALPIATAVHRYDALPETARGYAVDVITLGWEERLRARARRTSDHGQDFAISLPRGTVLAAGDCLILDALATVVRVVERQEPVLIVEPASELEWALFAYQIGNSHQPIMLTAREIVCADLPGMDQVLDQHAIPFQRAVRPFTPIGSTADGYRSGHQHSGVAK